jgi:hypothetical protein
MPASLPAAPDEQSCEPVAKTLRFKNRNLISNQGGFMNSKALRVIASAAVSLGVVAGGVGGGQMAVGIEPGTFTFSSEYTCQHTVRDAVSEGRTVRQGCTYIGPKILDWATASGPWIAVIV